MVKVCICVEDSLEVGDLSNDPLLTLASGPVMFWPNLLVHGSNKCFKPVLSNRKDQNRSFRKEIILGGTRFVLL